MNYDYRNIWRITAPIIISMILTQLIGITDVIYLGRVGTVALGAAGLGSTYFFAFFTLVSGFGVGAQIIISRRNGEKKYKKIGAVFYQGASFLILGSLGIIVLSYILSPYILKFMISNQEIADATLAYINFRILGLVPVACLVMFRSFFVGIAQTFALQLVSVSMVMFNVVLNYVFIFGYAFVPALGIKGAALASVLSEFLAVWVCGLYMAVKTDFKKYALQQFVCRNMVLLQSILKLSVWTMLQQFVSVFTWFLFFIAVAHLGTDELAISNILKNSAGIPWIFVISFAVSSATITGNLIGVLLFFGVFYYPILRIYTDNVPLIKRAVLPYFTALLCYIPLFSGFIWFQNVSATGNARYSMWIEFISMIFYMLFVWIFIYSLKMPLYVCMLSDGVYNLVVFLGSYRFMYSMKWMNKKV